MGPVIFYGGIMQFGSTFYLVFGLILVGLLICFFIVYFAKSRKEHVERPKYSIFDDEDEHVPPKS